MLAAHSLALPRSHATVGAPVTVLYPSIDLRAGRVVRLAQGDYDRETVYGDDAVDVEAAFVEGGAVWIHVVDLDAARSGVAANRATIAAIAAATAGRADVQAGGGVRTVDDAAALFDAGVARVVMGSAAVADPALVDQVAAVQFHPEKSAAAGLGLLANFVEGVA